jgi:hypothetical protein
MRVYEEVFRREAGWAAGVEPVERDLTAAAVVIDLDARTMAVAAGNPCVAPFEPLDVHWARGSAQGAVT